MLDSKAEREAERAKRMAYRVCPSLPFRLRPFTSNGNGDEIVINLARELIGVEESRELARSQRCLQARCCECPPLSAFLETQVYWDETDHI